MVHQLPKLRRLVLSGCVSKPIIINVRGVNTHLPAILTHSHLISAETHTSWPLKRLRMKARPETMRNHERSNREVNQGQKAKHAGNNI